MKPTPPSTCTTCAADITAALANKQTACPSCGAAFNQRAALTFPALRVLLAADAAVLLVLGLLLLLRPQQVELALGFHDLPLTANYILGILGCLFATTALGYATAARDPLRHIIWIQIGIARGALEVLLGLFYVLNGAVTWQQAGFGLAAAAAMTVAYLIFYPHPPRVVVVTPETP